MADVFFKDEDVVFKDEDVLFDDHYLHTLVIEEPYSVQSSESPTLVQEYSLVIDDGTQVNAADTIDIGGSLLAESCIQQNYADTVTLSQELTLVVSDTAHIQYVESVVVTTDAASTADVSWLDTDDSTFTDTTDTIWYPHELSTLTVIDCVQANVADTLALVAEALLVVQSPYNAQVTDAVALVQEHNGLAPQDCTQANVADTLDIAQEQNATGQDTYHAQTVDSPAFEQEHVLSLSDSTHIQSADEISFVVEGGEELALAVSDAIQTNVAEGASVFVQEYVLAIYDGTQSNVADTTSVLTEGTLDVSSTLQTQTVEGVVLQQEQILFINDAYNSNAAEELGAFAQIQVIIANDAVDEQYTETPTISELSADSVTVENATQTNIADTLTIIQEHILANSDCAQISTAETLDLIAEQLLGVSSCTQFHYPDAVSLITDTGILILNPYLYSITVARNMQSVTPNRYLVN